MQAFTLTPHGDVLLCLSSAETRGFRTLTTEDDFALLTDIDVARVVIKTKIPIDAAKRCLDAIGFASDSQN